MKSIKILAVAALLFVAFSFGVSTTSAPVEKPEKELEIAPHKIMGPVGMSDEGQF